MQLTRAFLSHHVTACVRTCSRHLKPCLLWQGKDAKKGPEKKSKDAQAAPLKEYYLTSQSQSLDLTSPAGSYQLELSHPASWLVLRHLLDLSKQLEAAVDKGMLPKAVSLLLKDVTHNGKPVKAGKLGGLAEATSGTVSFRVVSPSLLLATDPAPITAQSLDWLIVTLGDVSCGELWKLSVMQVVLVALATPSLHLSHPGFVRRAVEAVGHAGRVDCTSHTEPGL